MPDSATPTPAISTFTMELTAATEDIDALGHVSNLVYVRWLQHVAEAHSDHLGFDLAAYRRMGAIWVVRRHEIDYLAPAFAGDRVRLRTWVTTWKAASCVRKTEIMRIDPTRPTREEGSGPDDEENGAEDREVLLARGSTTWAFVSLETGRPQRVAKELRAAFV